jgi:hypothetical protein
MTATSVHSKDTLGKNQSDDLRGIGAMFGLRAGHDLPEEIAEGDLWNTNVFHASNPNSGRDWIVIDRQQHQNGTSPWNNVAAVRSRKGASPQGSEQNTGTGGGA